MTSFRDVAEGCELSIYADRLRTLTDQEAGLVVFGLAQMRIDIVGSPVTSVRAADLPTLLARSNLIAADAVGVLLSAPGPVAQNAIEKVLGRPVTILPAQPSPAPAPRHAGADPTPEDTGPNSRRRIVEIAPNPKRAGTGAHTRYALYREGMTISQYLAEGGFIRDVSWDQRQGYVRVVDE